LHADSYDSLTNLIAAGDTNMWIELHQIFGSDQGKRLQIFGSICFSSKTGEYGVIIPTYHYVPELFD
jgi:hypothetical protein